MKTVDVFDVGLKPDDYTLMEDKEHGLNKSDFSNPIEVSISKPQISKKKKNNRSHIGKSMDFDREKHLRNLAQS
jgi:hypothetical protein